MAEPRFGGVRIAEGTPEGMDRTVFTWLAGSQSHLKMCNPHTFFPSDQALLLNALAFPSSSTVSSLAPQLQFIQEKGTERLVAHVGINAPVAKQRPLL